MIDGSKRRCEECGHEANAQHKFCINCGGILSNQSVKKSLIQQKTSQLRNRFLLKQRTSLPTKTKIKIVLITFIVSLPIIIFMINLTIRLPTTVDPEAIEWISLTVTNPSFENAPWAEILESNYAIKGKNLYFLIKWNGSVPISISNEDLPKPRYLKYRKVNISWIISENSNPLFSEGELSVGHNNFFF